jgi:[acyl-carrier-protein] S-malonyltransferase
MTEWGRAYPGAGLMAIVDKGKELDYDKIYSLCKDFGVYVTLNNTKSQIVVGGSKRRLAEMGKDLKKRGKRSTMLKVEGPFHTPIMKPAADKFKRELDKSEIHIATKPVMANVSTEAIVDPIHITKELHEQIFKIVNWRGGIERIIRGGETVFIEVGPKKVLSNMINDIDPSIPKLNIEDVESLEKTVKELTLLTGG